MEKKPWEPPTLRRIQNPVGPPTDEFCHAHPDRRSVSYQIKGVDRFPVCSFCAEHSVGDPVCTECGGLGCSTCEQTGTLVAQLRYGGM